MKIGAVVVLYHPDAHCLDRILVWSKHIDEICVVDNSPQVWAELNLLQRNHSRVHYLHSGENQGIARALNLGIHTLANSGMTWVLTMDQDSQASETMVLELKDFVDQCPRPARTALLSPLHQILNSPTSLMQSYSLPLTLMTSGNLVRVQSWHELGGFDEKLFIDGVDDDFCLRLHLKDWDIIQVNSLVMAHPLGNQTHHQWGSRHFYPTHHSPIRRYYMTRNRLYLSRLYQRQFVEFSHHQKRNLYRDLFLVLAFERQKILKTWMTLRGIWDYWRGQMGPFRKF